ncbi:hypothetical protein NLI96_g11066 [Meripilus lineatus]|uniref:GST N-terminal domain-containing protein n=1 Tax=Meripilus lineatus TaxID=2056292 RepID=A0AAD5UTX2_9APHY|nr:hypothetical protein NLI96_g11066 [Physisporinus lineatus]
MSKPVLYTFGLSVWSAVPEIAAVELGYAPDAIEVRILNLVEGANFSPEFLSLNPNATLPTLVVDGKPYVNTTEVTRYLIEHAPKKVAPGSTAFIDRIHEDPLDPNFILLTARNEDELKAVASGFPLQFVQNRQNALDKYSQTPEAAAFKEFYDNKKTANGGVLAIYKGEVPEDVKTGFFNTSSRHWKNITDYITKELPGLLPDSGFIGGETPGEDDFHLAAWLARVAFVTGGNPNKGGYASLEKETKESIPKKVATYWDAWTERPGWKKVYAESLH